MQVFGCFFVWFLLGWIVFRTFADDMAKKALNEELKLQAFPEEITEEGLKIYGETSYEHQIATLSHYLHNSDFEGTALEVQERRNEMMTLIRDFLEHKDKLQEYTEEDIAFAARGNTFFIK